MNIEKRTAVVLKDNIIAIFKSEEDDVVDYIYDNYLSLGLYYDDISMLEFRTIYVEI